MEPDIAALCAFVSPEKLSNLYGHFQRLIKRTIVGRSESEGYFWNLFFPVGTIRLKNDTKQVEWSALGNVPHYPNA